MSLLLLFQNIRILLAKTGLSVQFIGSVNELDVTDGANNQVQFQGTETELQQD
jgi:hypothetical protein